MTVRELINKLKKFDKDLEVRVVEYADDDTRADNFWLSDVELDDSDNYDNECVLIGRE